MFNLIILIFSFTLFNRVNRSSMSNGNEFEAKNSGLLETRWLTAEAADEIVAVAVNDLLEVIAEDEGGVGVTGAYIDAEVEGSVSEHRAETTVADWDEDEDGDLIEGAVAEDDVDAATAVHLGVTGSDFFTGG